MEPYGRAIVARVVQETGIGTRDQVSVVADSAGVVGIEIRRGQRTGGGVILLQASYGDAILPLARTVASLLYDAEAYGRAAVDLWLMYPPNGYVQEQARKAVPRSLHTSSELTVPAGEDEVHTLAGAWHRELQREIGIVKYEREPDAHD